MDVELVKNVPADVKAIVLTPKPPALFGLAEEKIEGKKE